MNLSWFIVYILFVIIYLEEDKELPWYCVYKSTDSLGKICNSFKIFRNIPSIRTHIPGNLIRFLIKQNIGIVTILGIQIARHHIPRILNAEDNVDSRTPNVYVMNNSYYNYT